MDKTFKCGILDMVMQNVAILKKKDTKSKVSKLFEETNRCTTCATVKVLNPFYDGTKVWSREQQFMCMVCYGDDFNCLQDYKNEYDYCSCCARSKCSLTECSNIFCAMSKEETKPHNHINEYYTERNAKLFETNEFLKKEIFKIKKLFYKKKTDKNEILRIEISSF